jgi:predicted esterase
MIDLNDPHAGQPVLTSGAPLEHARAAMVMVHGRGASAGDILSLAGELARPDMAFLAPQAAMHTWYPVRFLAPTSSNQPWLDSALAALGRLLAQIAAAGIPPERTYLLGFSQGACLSLEYAARHGMRYGGLAGLSGALIGGDDEPRLDQGDLAGTPVFLGCSDIDPHIPLYRFERAANTLKALGGQVTARLYPGMGHLVNQDEVDFVKGMLE